VNRLGGGTTVRLATFGIPTGDGHARQFQSGTRFCF